jgi:hypothetical protein
MPNFLRNLYRAMRETRAPKVRSMKLIRSAREPERLERVDGEQQRAGVAEELVLGPAADIAEALDGAARLPGAEVEHQDDLFDSVPR